LQFGLNADDGGSKVEIAQFGTFGAVFNEGSADLDFRVESDDKPFCLFVNSTLDNVSIGYSAESQQSSKGLVVLSGDETGGVYIVKEDGSQPSSGEGLGSLGWRGIDDTNHMGAADAKISAFATENHDGSNSATDMRFFIKTTSEGPGNGATETMRLESNKNVKILDGNLVIGTAGHGIDFSATADGSGTDTSELLDDYEEGTWTPTVGGNASYSGQIGHYTKVGRAITAHFDVSINAIGTGSTSILSGLPYASHSISAPQTLSISYFQSIATACVFLGGYVQDNAQTMLFVGGVSSAVTISRNAFAVFGNSARIIGFTTYLGDT